MHNDIVALRQFYNSPLGRNTRDKLVMGLSAIWTPMHSERLLGLGYTLPYLERFCSDAERAMAFMPAGQGAARWPRHGPCAVSLVFDEELPLADASIDRVLMVHSLEFSENPIETLREVWRVLSPNGSVLIVVPNRRGVWSRFDHTPFGSGRPYSISQVASALREANFTHTKNSRALFFPPSERRSLLRVSSVWERFGRRFWPLFSGVIIIEAKKKVYQGLPVIQRSSRRVFVPVLSPQGSPVGRTDHIT